MSELKFNKFENEIDELVSFMTNNDWENNIITPIKLHNLPF